jgi:ABC-type antimicrobial peptide transport system permease subunit
MAASVFVQSVGSAVLGSFGVLALLITGTGLYGVLAHAVVQRRREIAIAVAVGATPRRVAVRVFRDGLRLAVPGVGCGLVLTLAVGAVIRSQLNGIGPADPVALLGSLGLVALVAALACAAPAWRAVRTDPISVLRAL